jgi:hypothetical protein
MAGGRCDGNIKSEKGALTIARLKCNWRAGLTRQNREVTMAHERLLELAKKVEAAAEMTAALAADATLGLRTGFPDAATAGLIHEDAVRSTDELLTLVKEALPGWHYSMHGRARAAGAWTCSLRRSDVLDDDEILGIGEADSLPQALLAAVLRIAARR